jgi:hypothetical protein
VHGDRGAIEDALVAAELVDAVATSAASGAWVSC